MNTLSRVLCSSLASLLIGPVASAQGALTVVDASGGAGSQAIEISEAIGITPNGGTILVRSGTYQPFVVNDRVLVIAAEPGATVIVDPATLAEPTYLPAVTISNVRPGKVVVLEGLQIQGLATLDGGSDAVSVSSCDGQVWLQDCKLTAGYGLGSMNVALRVTDGMNVLLTHGDLTGASSILPSGLSFLGPALELSSGRVFAHESKLVGGLGGAGAQVETGSFFATGCTLKGGNGYGLSAGFGCEIHINGGPGLLLGNGLPSAVLLDTALIPGPADTQNGCSNAGAPSIVNSGTLQQLPGASLHFGVESPAIDASSPLLTLKGPPGDLALVLLATSLGNVNYFQKYQGGLVTGGPFFFTLGVLPAPGGTLAIPLNLGDALAPGTGSTIFLQSAVIHQGGGALLGSASTLTTYDE